MNSKTKINNRLWQARHKSGLEQKQLAYLLGHKTVNQVSRYESGAKTPSLKTALKLELILRVPVRDLFPEHYQLCRKEIAAQTDKINLPDSYNAVNSERQPNSHICTYDNLLLQKKPSKDEIISAKTHSINLIRKLSDVIRRQ